MRRRHFLEAAATALAAAGQPIKGQEDRRIPPPHHTLKLGTQNDSSDQALGILAAFGVNHVCSTLPSVRMDANWSVEGLTRLRERVESFGIRLEMVPLPLSSSYITRSENPDIMLGKSPERDREIDTICQMIRNAARAGVPALKYNLTILGAVSYTHLDVYKRQGANASGGRCSQAVELPPDLGTGDVAMIRSAVEKASITL